MSAQQVVFQYLSPGSNTLTVPAGFSDQVLVYAWGAGGGPGYNGPEGGGGGFAEGILTVTSGETMIISVGQHGGVGPRDGSGIGGSGTNTVLALDGGTSGEGQPTNHRDDQNYGGGGGGGGATAVLVNGIPMIVAAGGGGGGGGRSYQTGTVGHAGGVATLTSTTPRGGSSQAGYSVGGGGGAGYPYGGSGGTSYGDDAGNGTGGYGGQNYANALVTSSTLTAGSGITVGGVSSPLYPHAKRGYAGYDGAVIVIFTKSFRAWIKDTTWKAATNAWVKANDDWKQISRAWIKADDQWKPIQSGVSLVPTPSTSEVVTVNITIAANTNNYILSDYLSATSYFPGRSIINLIVDSGVIVGSATVGTPALVIDGLVVGDLINLTNNGNIAGAGGQGGAAGSYVTSGGITYNSKGQPIYGYNSGGKGYYAGASTTTSIPGRPGEIGGPALYVTYATNLINNGTIAGGGGGGGGGGGPTGGLGGGGAGQVIGQGANNGTMTAGGAGAGLGGAGGARGTAGSAGTNDTNAGGVGGAPGAAIMGINKVTINTEGTIIGTRTVV